MADGAGFHSSMNLAALANGGAGVLKRQALGLKNDPDGKGKYIADLREVQVRTREASFSLDSSLELITSGGIQNLPIRSEGTPGFWYIGQPRVVAITRHIYH